jgi:hypothetical protein
MAPSTALQLQAPPGRAALKRQGPLVASVQPLQERTRDWRAGSDMLPPGFQDTWRLAMPGPPWVLRIFGKTFGSFQPFEMQWCRPVLHMEALEPRDAVMVVPGLRCVATTYEGSLLPDLLQSAFLALFLEIATLRAIPGSEWRGIYHRLVGPQSRHNLIELQIELVE